MEITHDYVDYETAKKLQNLGWTQITDRFYTNVWGKYCLVTYETFKGLKGGVAAPEHWQVCKWLRVVHSIFIGIELIDNSRETCYQPTIWTMKDREYHDEDCMDQAKSICNWKEWKYSTPEEAELEAIKYCLNNLIDGNK